MHIFGKVKTNLYKFENLLLPGSKISNILCSDIFVEKLFGLISSLWTDTRIQCKWVWEKQPATVHSELYVCTKFYHHIKEKKEVLKAAGTSKKYR